MVIPIGDENHPNRKTPFVVYTIVAINVLLFILQLLRGDVFTLAYAAVPFEITNGVDLVRPQPLPGGQMIPQMPGPSPIWLTIFSSMFLHGSFMHIIGNMLYLWIFGDNIEDNFGHLRFTIFYLVCGIVAMFAQVLLDPNSVVPTLGASGAIAGVLGAYLIMFPHNRIRVLTTFLILTVLELPAIVVLGFWIVLQFFGQLGSITDNTAQTGGGGVAYMAHIGGFVAGLALAFILRKKAEPPWYQRDRDLYN